MAKFGPKLAYFAKQLHFWPISSNGRPKKTKKKIIIFNSVTWYAILIHYRLTQSLANMRLRDRLGKGININIVMQSWAIVKIQMVLHSCGSISLCRYSLADCVLNLVNTNQSTTSRTSSIYSLVYRHIESIRDFFPDIFQLEGCIELLNSS